MPLYENPIHTLVSLSGGRGIAVGEGGHRDSHESGGSSGANLDIPAILQRPV